MGTPQGKDLRMLRTTGDRAMTFHPAHTFAHTFGSFNAGLQIMSIAFCRLLTIQAMLL
jgi:hypothetical protein